MMVVNERRVTEGAVSGRPMTWSAGTFRAPHHYLTASTCSGPHRFIDDL